MQNQFGRVTHKKPIQPISCSRKTDGKCSRNSNKLKPPEVPTGTNSPIISKDPIVAKGEDVNDCEVPVLNGVNDDDGVSAVTEPVFPPDHTKVYFRHSPLDVRHKSPCVAQSRSDLIQ